MPDAKGKFSIEEMDRAASFINEKSKLPGDPCVHCGSTDTSVGEYAVRLGVGFAPIPPTHIPLMPVVCNNCGNIRLFSAILLGIVPYNPPSEDVQPNAESADAKPPAEGDG